MLTPLFGTLFLNIKEACTWLLERKEPFGVNCYLERIRWSENPEKNKDTETCSRRNEARPGRIWGALVVETGGCWFTCTLQLPGALPCRRNHVCTFFLHLLDSLGSCAHFSNKNALAKVKDLPVDKSPGNSQSSCYFFNIPDGSFVLELISLGFYSCTPSCLFVSSTSSWVGVLSSVHLSP